ncbi:MAG TPA: hypothetical protein PKC09_11705 [Paracoccus sp. (in: a-proteobacteria)]|uniref:hypothetical protein n=1 Tax=uncultured Paracoccus sp. TaxID=189685 RepID=UPI0026016507|nr:hypothetical protein [uncultured Paracoccus sp.]HMQ41926.1 hypothetical protein [Paracoccus sp. (in: a-proteobacteria)]HMR37783.1 hypothetical protein [Paracoccus sp. (in: a-proteobacteria)]
MADPARLKGGVVPRILASWRRPGEVVRGLRPISEGALLAILMAAMLIFWIAQAPGHARAAVENPDVPLGGRMAGAAMAVIFIMPLIAYAVAALADLALRLAGWRIAPADGRLALFWALLAVAPAVLLTGLVAGLVGPGAGLNITGALSGLGFLFIWGAGLRALAVRS